MKACQVYCEPVNVDLHTLCTVHAIHGVQCAFVQVSLHAAISVTIIGLTSSEARTI